MNSEQPVEEVAWRLFKKFQKSPHIARTFVARAVEGFVQYAVRCKAGETCPREGGDPVPQ